MEHLLKVPAKLQQPFQAFVLPLHIRLLTLPYDCCCVPDVPQTNRQNQHYVHMFRGNVCVRVCMCVCIAVQ